MCMFSLPLNPADSYPDERRATRYLQVGECQLSFPLASIGYPYHQGQKQQLTQFSVHPQWLQFMFVNSSLYLLSPNLLIFPSHLPAL